MCPATTLCLRTNAQGIAAVPPAALIVHSSSGRLLRYTARSLGLTNAAITSGNKSGRRICLLKFRTKCRNMGLPAYSSLLLASPAEATQPARGTNWPGQCV